MDICRGCKHETKINAVKGETHFYCNCREACMTCPDTKCKCHPFSGGKSKE